MAAFGRPVGSRIALLRRGDRSRDPAEQVGLAGLFKALADCGVAGEPVVYADDAVNAVRDQLLGFAGVLVWIDPITDGHDRSRLDAMLRDVAAQDVWVSAHPDAILKMGTKDVLVQTCSMPWGTDCVKYSALEQMARDLPRRLESGARVLKQHRGNGGEGVWKVEYCESGAAGLAAEVSVLHAQRSSRLERISLAEFINRCAAYFAAGGGMIEQPYQERLADGMVRCYLVQDQVAGFGHQFVTALLPLPPGVTESPVPPPRLYYGPDKPEFQRLKAMLETEWVAAMQRLLDVDRDSLPLLWDADFLLGPRDDAGQDTYVLCEINISSVHPFPEEVPALLATAVSRRLQK